MEQPQKKFNFIFFGTSYFSVIILDELKVAGFTPTLVVTVPDKPKGRALVMTSPETKVWAETHNVPCVQFGTLKNAESETEIKKYFPDGCDVGVVASYGNIIPQNILDIPRRGMLNVHPSLLPKLRGASPLQSAILSEHETGVTIMHLDAQMDHGGIVAQEKIAIHDWPPYALDLEELLGHAGGKLLAEVLPRWIAGTATETVQNHTEATFTKKIEKADAKLDLSAPMEVNLRKIRAYHVWPGAYFFHTHKSGKKIRVIVTRAHVENGILTIERVIPEGKKEMNYSDFLRGN
jgi:methionyl-tRNA formyltransferase